jgi:hypothetical protein
MAKQNLADPGKQFTDPAGTVWDQVTYRRLTSGDYVRIMLEQGGRRLLVQFGLPAVQGGTDIVEWQWELPLVPQDAVCLVGDGTYGLMLSDRVTESVFAAAHAKIADLESKLEAAMLENKTLKDGQDAAKAG